MKILTQFWRIRGKLNRKDIPNTSSFNVPVYFNGEGEIKLGKEISFGYSLSPKIGNGSILIQARYIESQISIGDYVEFSNNISVIAIEKIVIGSNCLIADSVSIFDSDFHDISPNDRSSKQQRLESDGLVVPTIIEENVWIGSHSIILKGVRVGKDSIVGAGSVVTKDIPSGVIACGVPAKVIRHLDGKKVKP